jgi:hypothetical protein
LDPVALAWYRYRIESGHYDSAEIVDRILERLEPSPPPRESPPRR